MLNPRPRLAAALLILLLVLPAGSQTPPPKTPIPASAEAADALKHMLLDLREVRGLASGIPGSGPQKRMQQLLDQIEQRARRLNDLVATAGGERVALPKPDFDKLVASLKREAFDGERFNALKVSAAHAYYSSDQARVLVAAFQFGDGRKKAAILLYPRLIDPVNFPAVLGVITFDTDRKAVLKAVARP